MRNYFAFYCSQRLLCKKNTLGNFQKIIYQQCSRDRDRKRSRDRSFYRLRYGHGHGHGHGHRSQVTATSVLELKSMVDYFL